MDSSEEEQEGEKESGISSSEGGGGGGGGEGRGGGGGGGGGSDRGGEDTDKSENMGGRQGPSGGERNEVFHDVHLYKDKMLDIVYSAIRSLSSLSLACTQAFNMGGRARARARALKAWV